MNNEIIENTGWQNDGDDSHNNIEEDYDDSMDGDFDSGMASAGMGTDEDYQYCDDDFCDF
jgi:hypothetical protein